MTSRLKFLGAAGVLFLWAHMASSTPIPPPTALPAAPEPPRGYARFHANDSHIGRRIPCTHDEKVCFRHNLIFHAHTDKCQPLNDGGHQCFLTADRNVFEKTGHIVGKCREFDDPCRYWIGTRMAYDGRCYNPDAVKEICGCGNTVTPNFLGGNECRCSSTEYVNVVQPEEEGSCLIPDFRNPRPTHELFYDQPLPTNEKPRIKLECDARQRRCFKQEKVWVEGANGCHSLLKRGPCPEDHVVVIDGRAAEKRHANTTCLHVRGGCPPGQKRMAFDGECYRERDIAISAPGAVVMNAFGVHEVLNYYVSAEYTPRISEREGACEVQFLKYPGELDIVNLPEAPCNPDHNPPCSFKEVFPAPPREEQ